MPTSEKAAVIEEMTEKLQRARSAVLLQTQGLTVAEMTELRRRLAAAGVELHVVKNTLLGIASQRAQYQALSQNLNCQTTIARTYFDGAAPSTTQPGDLTP